LVSKFDDDKFENSSLRNQNFNQFAGDHGTGEIRLDSSDKDKMSGN